MPDIERVVGVDVIPPAHDIGSADFVRADIRNPMIGKVIEQADVDTVVHMNVIATPTFVGGRTPQKEINVIGTMQLLAACQKAPRVRRLVVKSSAAVYGSSPRDPAMFTEEMTARRCRARASARTRSRSRATCGGSPGVGPTPRSSCCASRTSSVRTSARR